MQTQPLPCPVTPFPARLLYSRKEASSLLGISERQIDYMILRGEIGVRKLGSRVLIPFGEMARLGAIGG